MSLNHTVQPGSCRWKKRSMQKFNLKNMNHNKIKREKKKNREKIYLRCHRKALPGWSLTAKLRRPRRRGLGQTTESLPFIFFLRIFSSRNKFQLKSEYPNTHIGKTKIQNEIFYIWKQKIDSEKWRKKSRVSIYLSTIIFWKIGNVLEWCNSTRLRSGQIQT